MPRITSRLLITGCWRPDLHADESGVLVPAERLADALLDPAYERDGISFLGGEPMQQPHGLLALVQSLRAKGCSHLVCYTGYTYEALVRRARREPTIAQILDALDILVDGPYIAALAAAAGMWTGSGNQRVIDLVATRRTGGIVLYQTAEGEPPTKRCTSWATLAPAATMHLGVLLNAVSQAGWLTK